MRCPQFKWATFRQLPKAEQAALLHHATECPDCTATWAAFQAQDRVLADLPEVRPSEHLLRATLARTTQRPPAHVAGIKWRTIAVTITALLLFALAGSYGVAAQALPGDPLYGLKRAGEQVRLAFTLNAEARARYQDALEAVRRAEVAEALRTGKSAEVAFGGRIEQATETELLV
ncbi:MAG: DUF5667 domain-containing protein [Anaerolineae bacterium]